MSNFYQAVNWNRQKRIYDTTVATGVVLYLALFTATTFALDPNATAETTLIRALGTCALVLLHLILCIGPLCRLKGGSSYECRKAASCRYPGRK